MTIDEFEKEAAQALQELPAGFIEKISNLEVVVDDSRAKQNGAVLFGLYQGVPVSERNTFYAGAMPDKITLFRRNIEEACRNDEEVKREIKKTVIHEIAHHFGLDEKTIRKAGF